MTLADDERYAELQEVALEAARQGDTERLQSMLEHGLPVNLSNTEGNSLLMLAAYNDHPKTVTLLLERNR